MKNILVCGASGFIGKNIVKTLKHNSQIKIIGQYFKNCPTKDNNVKYIKADLTKETDVDKITKNIDIIIQAAAVTSGSKDIIGTPYIHVTDNVIMNSLLLKYSFKNNIKNFIFFSCSVMYKSSKKRQREVDFKSNSEIDEKYFGVGWTKVYIEKMCNFYSKLGRTSFLVLRHSNIYGPYDKFDLNKSHVLGASINKVVNSKKEIQIWGDGTEMRDFLYVDDLMSFLKKYLKLKFKEKFLLLNVGSGELISILNLVKTILKINNKQLKIIKVKDKPQIKTNICLDITLAKKKMNWSPKVSLQEGLKKTIKWYKDN